jgi:hypothetical protein
MRVSEASRPIAFDRRPGEPGPVPLGRGGPDNPARYPAYRFAEKPTERTVQFNLPGISAVIKTDPIPTKSGAFVFDGRMPAGDGTRTLDIQVERLASTD